MRIESLEYYKYFFQSLKEEPLKLKRFSLFLLLIPVLGLCHFFEWNQDLLLFLGLGYLSMAIGFQVAMSMRSQPTESLKKQYLNNLIADSIPDMVMVIRNSDQKILFANSKFCKKLKVEKENVSNYRIKDFVDKKDHYLFQDESLVRRSNFKVRSIPSIKNKSDQIRIFNHSGQHIEVEMTSTSYGELAEFTMYIFKDVTSFKVLQQTNRQFALDLKARIEKLNSRSSGKLISIQSRDRVFS